MDIDEAKQLVAGSPPTTMLPEIRADLASRHGSAPQRAMQAQVAMDEIEHGLAELAKLGERFWLTQAKEEETQGKEEEPEPFADPKPVDGSESDSSESDEEESSSDKNKSGAVTTRRLGGSSGGKAT